MHGIKLAASIVAICAAVALAPAAALAEESSMAVMVGDLNLDTQSGARTALRRIKREAALFCGDRETRIVSLQLASRRCQAVMVDKTVAKLDAPQVTALHQKALGVELAGR